MNENEKKTSDAELTPEQMEEAIALWKAKNATDGEGKKDTKDSAEQKPPAEKSDSEKPAEKAEPPAKAPGSSVEEKLAAVRDRRDRRDSDGAPADIKGAKGVIAQQDEDLDTLTACLEMLLAEKAKIARVTGHFPRQPLGQPKTHFAGRRLGEGDHQQPIGFHRTNRVGQKAEDSLHQHGGFTRTGRRRNQQGTVSVNR